MLRVCIGVAYTLGRSQRGWGGGRHKNRENQEKWEEKGKLARSLPLRTGRAGYGPAYTLEVHTTCMVHIRIRSSGFF